MTNLCNQCGACCRVLTLPEGPDELQSVAAVARALGLPSDHVFAAEHWHPLSRDEAMRRNPFYTSRLPAGAHLYWCGQLGPDGRCLSHATRPFVCRGYPWYGQPVRDMPLADPRCGYAHDQIEEFVIRRGGG